MIFINYEVSYADPMPVGGMEHAHKANEIGSTKGRQMNQSQQDKLEVSVVGGGDGTDRIALSAGDSGESRLLTLTPSQARLLATQLIAAVNRAEVKANLKTGKNIWRQPGESRPRLATAG